MMILIERNVANNLLLLLQDLTAFIPDEYLSQLQLLEQQLNEFQCDEELITFFIQLFKKQAIHKSESNKKVSFFEENEGNKECNKNSLELKIEQTIVMLQWLTDVQNKKYFKGIGR